MVWSIFKIESVGQRDLFILMHNRIQLLRERLPASEVCSKHSLGVYESHLTLCRTDEAIDGRKFLRPSGSLYKMCSSPSNVFEMKSIFGCLEIQKCFGVKCCKVLENLLSQCRGEAPFRYGVAMPVPVRLLFVFPLFFFFFFISNREREGERPQAPNRLSFSLLPEPCVPPFPI